ncbi:MAG: glycosyl transferase family 51, partial [Limisphaerales bacterium]
MNPSHVETSDWWKHFAPKGLSKPWSPRRQRWALAVLALGFLSTIGVVELLFAPIESRLFANIDRRLTFRLEPGPSSTLQRPGDGPYDERLGFSDLVGFTSRLQQNGYRITAQARVARPARLLARIGLGEIYHEKTQAGLRIDDQEGVPLFEARYPERIYPEFRAIPPLVVNTLLFIENRQLQD